MIYNYIICDWWNKGRKYKQMRLRNVTAQKREIDFAIQSYRFFFYDLQRGNGLIIQSVN